MTKLSIAVITVARFLKFLVKAYFRQRVTFARAVIIARAIALTLNKIEAEARAARDAAAAQEQKDGSNNADQHK